VGRSGPGILTAEPDSGLGVVVLRDALEPIIVIDGSGEILDTSNSVSRVFGWTRSELIGRNVSMLMPAPYRTAHDGYLKRFAETRKASILGTPRELDALHRSGRRIPIELCVSQASVVGASSPVYVGIVRDLTGRRQAERLRSLREALTLRLSSGADLDRALEGAIETICAMTGWDYGEAWIPQGQVRMLDAHWASPDVDCASMIRSAQLGILPNEGLIGRVWVSGIPESVPDLDDALPENSQRLKLARACGLRSALAVPIDIGDDEWAVFAFFSRHLRPQNDDVIELLNATLAPVGSVIKRRSLEDELRLRERRLSLALEAAAMGSWEWDLDSDDLHWDERQHALFGVIPGLFELKGISALAMIHPEDKARVEHAIRRAANGQSPFTEEFRVRRPDGSLVWLAGCGRRTVPSHQQPGPGGSGRRLMGVNYDITARKRGEETIARHSERLQSLVAERTRELEARHEQLRMADRLASIGTLVAGLGHDMNNVLLPIRARLNTIRSLASGPGVGSSIVEQVEQIGSGIEYLQQLTDGLHFLSSDAQTAGDGRARTSLGAWWARVGPLVCRAVPSHVEVTAEVPDWLGEVAVEPHRLTQAVLNLVVNAGEATPEPGATETRARCPVLVRAVPGGEPGVVSLTVADRGAGMTEDVRARCTDTFYTTKPRGLGTGLGLALVRGVVEHAGGELVIESEPGEGTSVTMNLPVWNQAACGDAHTALVSIRDGRTASIIEHELNRLGLRTTDRDSSDAGKPGSAVSIWIVDPDRLGDAQAWCDGADHRIVVLVGRSAPTHSQPRHEFSGIVIHHPRSLESIREGLEAASRRISTGLDDSSKASSGGAPR